MGDFSGTKKAYDKMHSHPEAKCQECNGKNPIWYAENELWNRVMGSPNGIICPACFSRKAEALGLATILKCEQVSTE